MSGESTSTSKYLLVYNRDRDACRREAVVLPFLCHPTPSVGPMFDIGLGNENRRNAKSRLACATREASFGKIISFHSFRCTASRVVAEAACMAGHQHSRLPSSRPGIA